VADFIGNPRINFVESAAERTSDGEIRIISDLGRMRFASGQFTPQAPTQNSFPCVVGIRPEKLLISETPMDGAIEATVYSVQPEGSETTIHLTAGNTRLMAREMGIRSYGVDQRVYLKLDPDKANVFDKQSGCLIKQALQD